MEDHQKFVKSKEKYKRRSSFFQRRLSSYNSDSPTATYTSSTLTANQYQCDVSSTQEVSAEQQYLSKLKKEKEDWNDMLNKLRKEEQELNNKCHEVAFTMDLLTAEDKKYLEDRPDYTAFGRLLDSVTESVMIKEQLINNTKKKCHNLLKLCEQITKETTEDIIISFIEGYDELNGVPPPS